MGRGLQFRCRVRVKFLICCESGGEGREEGLLGGRGAWDMGKDLWGVAGVFVVNASPVLWGGESRDQSESRPIG